MDISTRDMKELCLCGEVFVSRVAGRPEVSFQGFTRMDTPKHGWTPYAVYITEILFQT